MNAIIRFLFRIVWRRRLRDLRLVRVTGWRSCLYDDKWGQRVKATWVFGKSNAPAEARAARRVEPLFGEWISCVNLYPSGPDEVLVWDGEDIDLFMPDTGVIPEHRGPARCIARGVTHWMPVPKPPNNVLTVSGGRKGPND